MDNRGPEQSGANNETTVDTTDDRALGFRQAVRSGGVRTVAILAALNVVDEFDTAVLAVFAPDIQDTLGLSTTALAAIGTASGAVFVAGAIPIGWLADRSSRSRIVAIATAVWATATAAVGFVTNAFQFVAARVVTGLGKSNSLPVHGSMLADTYPEQARGSVYALHGTAASLGRVIAPISVGGLAVLLGGGVDAWQGVILVVAIPVFAMAIVAAVALRDPPRGRFERARVLGDQADTVTERPIAIDMAFARLRRIATFDRLATGIGVIGFTLFSVPIFVSLVLEDEFGLGAGARGVVSTIAALSSVVIVPFAAGFGGRVFQRTPARTLHLMGAAVVAASLCTTVAVFMPNSGLLTVWFALGGAIGTAGFVMLSVVVAAIVPPSLRSQGFSLIGVYVFLIGGFFGAVITGIVADALGPRTAIPVVLLPGAVIGGYLIARGGETIGADMQRVTDDLLEEADEAERRRRQDREPLLQVRGLHVSIGSVEILHGIDLDIEQGEIVGLVGTNGAGKSTLLRAISGLAVADRGVVRFGPTDVTLQAAHQRTRLGIAQLSGGRSSFGELTVRENLDVGALTIPASERHQRIDRSLEVFDELQPLLDRRADRLSGGQQQMLGLARTLLLEPRLLLIDELSLGLAPIVVQRLLERLELIRQQGTTVLIVEQSLNTAAAAADRVVFLDRGRVVYEGTGAELLERRDLARAVFLGSGMA